MTRSKLERLGVRPNSNQSINQSINRRNQCTFRNLTYLFQWNAKITWMESEEFQTWTNVLSFVHSTPEPSSSLKKNRTTWLLRGNVHRIHPNMFFLVVSLHDRFIRSGEQKKSPGESENLSNGHKLKTSCSTWPLFFEKEQIRPSIESNRT